MKIEDVVVVVVDELERQQRRLGMFRVQRRLQNRGLLLPISVGKVSLMVGSYKV